MKIIEKFIAFSAGCSGDDEREAKLRVVSSFIYPTSPSTTSNDGDIQLENIVPFCFPLDSPDKHTQEPYLHEFVLTDEKGSKRFVSTLKTTKIWWTADDDKAAEDQNRIFCYSVISSSPNWDFLKACLSSFYLLASEPKRFYPDAFLWMLVNSCFLPPPDMSITVRLPCFSQDFVISNSSPYRTVKTIGFPIRTILQTISVANFVTAFSLVLLEKSIFLTSASSTLLNRLGETLTTLLQPLNWQMVYVPVIPVMLRDLTQAPTPFLMGGHSSWASRVRLNKTETEEPDDESMGGHFTKFNIDSDELTEESLKVAELAAKLPGREKLILDLRKAMGFQVENMDSLYTSLESERKPTSNKRIQECFLNWFRAHFATVLNFYKQDGRFDDTKWILSKDVSEHEFFAAVSKTTMFQEFVDSRAYLSKEADLTFKCELDSDLYADARIAPVQNNSKHRRYSTLPPSLQGPLPPKFETVSLSSHDLDVPSSVVIDLQNPPTSLASVTQGHKFQFCVTRFAQFDGSETRFQNNPVSKVMQQIQLMSNDTEKLWMTAHYHQALCANNLLGNLLAARQSWDAFCELYVSFSASSKSNTRNPLVRTYIDHIVASMKTIHLGLASSNQENWQKLLEGKPESILNLVKSWANIVHPRCRSNKSVLANSNSSADPVTDKLVLNCDPTVASHVIDSLDSLDDDDQLFTEQDLDPNSRALLTFPVQIAVDLAEKISSMFQLISQAPFGFGEPSLLRETNKISTESMNEISTPFKFTANAKRHAPVKLAPKLTERQKKLRKDHFVLNDISSLRLVKKMPTYELFRQKLVLLRLIRLDELKTSQEKLTFWMNVRNALLMHIYVEFGAPLHMAHKMSFTYVKPVYNIGGFYYSINDITYGILRPSMPLPQNLSRNPTVARGAGDQPATGLELSTVTVLIKSSQSLKQSDAHNLETEPTLQIQPHSIRNSVKLVAADPRLKHSLDNAIAFVSMVTADNTKSGPRMRVFKKDTVLADLRSEALVYIDSAFEFSKTVTTDGPKSEPSAFSMARWSSNASKTRQLAIPQLLSWHVKDFTSSGSVEAAVLWICNEFPGAFFVKQLKQDGLLKQKPGKAVDPSDHLSVLSGAPLTIEWQHLVLKVKEHDLDFEIKLPF